MRVFLKILGCFVCSRVSVVQTIYWSWDVLIGPITAEEVLRVPCLSFEFLLLWLHIDISKHLRDILRMRAIQTLSIVGTLFLDGPSATLVALEVLLLLKVDFGLGLLKVDSTVLRLELVVDARLAAVVWNVLLH